MTNEQKIREIYPIIPKIDKTNPLIPVLFNYNNNDGKEYFILAYIEGYKYFPEDYKYFNEI